MTPEDYDAWYDSRRGRWIGEREFAISRDLLRVRPGETLLDVGCGTGWFSRRHADAGVQATGLDRNLAWLAYARHRTPGMTWLGGDMRRLPFADAAFDHVLSVAALCFVPDERGALAEMLRVARHRVVVGWLNRNSLLYREKAGRGAYAGARWHTVSEIRALLTGMPVGNVQWASCIYLPNGGWLARLMEGFISPAVPLGAMVFASVAVPSSNGDK